MLGRLRPFDGSELNVFFPFPPSWLTDEPSVGTYPRLLHVRKQVLHHVVHKGKDGRVFWVKEVGMSSNGREGGKEGGGGLTTDGFDDSSSENDEELELGKRSWKAALPTRGRRAGHLD